MKLWSDPVQPFPRPLHLCLLTAFPGETPAAGRGDSSGTHRDHILPHHVNLLQPLVLPAGEVKPRCCPAALALLPLLG